MVKFKKQRQSSYYTHTRTYHILLVIVGSLCLGIVALGYEVLNKSENLPFVSTAVTLLLLGVVLIAVLELFNNLKQEEEYIEAKTVFVSVASHDLHSPLTGISWAADALAAQMKDPEQKARVLAIEESSQSMLQTVDDALSITSLDRLAKQKITPQNIDLLELVDGTIKSFKLTAAQKNVTVMRSGKWPSSYSIMADEKQFRRVIANIISNEVKFTYPNTSVPLTFSEGQDHWSIAFHDQGPTIKPEDQERIFELHKRTKDSNKSGAPGVGFGLYLARQIILAHNGTLAVDPNAKEGTTFILTMPKSSS
jgi:two-component system sensor histidine kinase VicK